MTEKMPSSVRLGLRPRILRRRAYSAPLSPCSATISGVIGDVVSVLPSMQVLGGEGLVRNCAYSGRGLTCRLASGGPAVAAADPRPRALQIFEEPAVKPRVTEPR